MVKRIKKDDWVRIMQSFIESQRKVNSKVVLNVAGGIRSGKSSLGLFQSSYGEPAVLEKVHVLTGAMRQLREQDRVLCYCGHSFKSHRKQGFMCVACGCKHMEAAFQ